MKNSLSKSSFGNFCLGYDREHYTHLLLTKGVESIAFGHWLAIPSQKMLLVFQHQRCVAINHYYSIP